MRGIVSPLTNSAPSLPPSEPRMIENVLFRREREKEKESFVARESESKRLSVSPSNRTVSKPREDPPSDRRAEDDIDISLSLSLRRLYASQMICGAAGDGGRGAAGRGRGRGWMDRWARNHLLGAPPPLTHSPVSTPHRERESVTILPHREEDEDEGEHFRAWAESGTERRG